MWRNTRPKPGKLSRIVPLRDLRNFVQTGNDRRIRVRHPQFHKISDRPELRTEFLDQFWNSVPGSSGNRDGVRVLMEIFVKQTIAFKCVNLVENHDCRFAGGSNFGEHAVDGANLLGRLGMADVHDVQEQFRLNDLLERRFESFNVANNLSSASTAEPVSALRSVDFPALV
jgi:hypothetical protein